MAGGTSTLLEAAHRLNDDTVRAVWTQKARADADGRELALAKGRVIVLEERAGSQQADNMARAEHWIFWADGVENDEEDDSVLEQRLVAASGQEPWSPDSGSDSGSDVDISRGGMAVYMGR